MNNENKELGVVFVIIWFGFFLNIIKKMKCYIYLVFKFLFVF